MALSLGVLGALVIVGHTGRAMILPISIDTLRADHLGGYGYPRATSPFIDSVAANGTVFENAMVPLPATDPSHASLLMALHSVRYGVHLNRVRLASEAETMAEVLSGQGYDTMGPPPSLISAASTASTRASPPCPTNARGTRPGSEVNASVVAMLEDYARTRKDAVRADEMRDYTPAEVEMLRGLGYVP